ncbi:hypothetical protein PybrP1_005677 [[Pythium] brassicae (nom. inval.)]|nr:hypothetical protein PybrP1_005677 [[Pythium] brassicae (nom. inval.)]
MQPSTPLLAAPTHSPADPAVSPALPEHTQRLSSALCESVDSPASIFDSEGVDAEEEEAPARSPQPKKKRKARICKTEGCEKYVVDRGLCIRHGGGKRCSVDSCNCRAQNRGLCWKHGGYTRCTHAGCAKIAVSHGLCWAHGGGKRCLVNGCQKPAYERNGNLCVDHCQEALPQ